MNDLIRDSLDHCVKCTICETFCPVSQVTPLFPGPKYVGPQAERYRGAGPSSDASVDYCSGCGICTQVCPQDVKIAEINSRARAKLWEKRGVPLRNQMIARPTVIGRLGTPVAPLANWALHNRAVRGMVQSVVGIHRDAPMPSFAGRTFQKWSRSHRGAPEAPAVVYFHGCGTNYYEPLVGEMVTSISTLNAEILLADEAPAVTSEATPSVVPVPALTAVAIGLCLAVTVVFGVWPAPLLDFCRQATLLFIGQ